MTFPAADASFFSGYEISLKLDVPQVHGGEVSRPTSTLREKLRCRRSLREVAAGDKDAQEEASEVAFSHFALFQGATLHFRDSAGLGIDLALSEDMV